MKSVLPVFLVVCSFIGSAHAHAQKIEFWEAFPAYVGGRVSSDPATAELCKWENILLGRITDADFAVMRYVPVQSFDGLSLRCFQKRIADLLTSAEAYSYARQLRSANRPKTAPQVPLSPAEDIFDFPDFESTLH